MHGHDLAHGMARHGVAWHGMAWRGRSSLSLHASSSPRQGPCLSFICSHAASFPSLQPAGGRGGNPQGAAGPPARRRPAHGSGHSSRRPHHTGECFNMRGYWVSAGRIIGATNMQHRGAAPTFRCWTQAVTWLLAHAWHGHWRCRHAFARGMFAWSIPSAWCMPCHAMPPTALFARAMPCHAMPCHVHAHLLLATVPAPHSTQTLTCLHHANPHHNHRSTSTCPLLGKQSAVRPSSRCQWQESRAWWHRLQSGAPERKPLLRNLVSEALSLVCFFLEGETSKVGRRVSWAVEPQAQVAVSCCHLLVCPSDFLSPCP